MPGDREAKCGVFWKAVAALQKYASKESLIVEPRTLGIHASSSHELLGIASAQEYEWVAGKMGRLFPDIKLPELRRAMTTR